MQKYIPSFILAVIIIAVVHSMLSGRAAFPVDDAEVEKQLCPFTLCMDNSNYFTDTVCEDTRSHDLIGKSYVFGAYAIGYSACFCPCNFQKFYKTCTSAE